MADDDLAKLMRATQAGDVDAYLRLLEAITPRIRQVVRHRRGFMGPAAVDDIVQDILLSLHAVRSTYDPDRPFMPWLLAIVRSRLADHARRDARQTAREQPIENPDVTFANTSTNDEHERFETRETLKHAIQSLPMGQREAIELLKLRELSLKEAAAVSGLSIGALKVATHRAMRALRRVLNRTGSHED